MATPKPTEDWANCIISYTRDDDFACNNANMVLIGGARDKDGKEVHIWVNSEKDLFRVLTRRRK